MSELLIPNFLRGAIINQRIYPPGSPIVERSVTQITQALQGALTTDKITYTCREGKVFLKGKELPDGNTLVPYLLEHGIQSITFLPGLGAPEVAQLVILLSRKKLTDGTVAEWFVQNKVTHIEIDKVTVVEIMEGEVVMKQVDRLFEGLQDFQGLMGSIRESYDMMDKIPDEAGKSKVQEHVARKLAGMQPALLRDMFDNELPKHVEDSGLKPMVLNAMTQDKIHEIFSEIGTWYKQVRESATSDFEVVEHLNKLKSFLGKLLNAPASKKVPFALYEEMISQGLLDKVPEGVEKKPEQESLALQVDRLLEQPAESLLEQPTRDQLPFILKKLCDVGLDDMSQRLLEKVIELLSGQAPMLRQVATRSARSFFEILMANRKDRLWNVLTSTIEKQSDLERVPEVYKELAGILSMTSIHFVLNDRDADAARLLAQLRRHRHEENPLFPKRQEQAGQALQQVSDSVMEALTEDLLSNDKAKKDAAQLVLAQLGEGAIPCFVRMIKQAPDVRHRRLAASALKYYGAAGRAKLSAEFHLGNTTDALLNVLSVLDDFLAPDLVARFEPMVHFPDAAIRRRMVQLLAKMPEPAKARLLVTFLDDPDEAVQVDAIRAAGETRTAETVPKLVDLLKSGSTRRMEETCLALGQIADAQAVPVLTELLEPKSGGLFKRKTAIEETVRVRAAWALAQFKSGEARDVLGRMSKDANLQVQTIARNALSA